MLEDSILNSTKQILGISSDYTAFDLDILTHINATFSDIEMLGVGPDGGFMIEDATTKWSDLNVPQNQKNTIMSLLYLKVKLLFDPPSTSFHLDAMQKQIEQMEWKLNVAREALLHPIVEGVIT